MGSSALPVPDFLVVAALLQCSLPLWPVRGVIPAGLARRDVEPGEPKRWKKSCLPLDRVPKIIFPHRPEEPR